MVADDEDEEELVDRGVGAVAELPSGVPDWPPGPFLARQQTYSRPWQKYLVICHSLS